MGQKRTFSHRGEDASLPFCKIGEESWERSTIWREREQRMWVISTFLLFVLSGEWELRASAGGGMGWVALVGLRKLEADVS